MLNKSFWDSWNGEITDVKDVCLPVVVIIMDVKLPLRQPVELQQFTEQLVWEVLTQLSAQEALQLAV